MTTEYFQHYKGNLYEKIADATDSETMQKMVVYRSCKTGDVWVRSARMFNGPAFKGGAVPRFRRIESAEEVFRLLREHRLTPTTMEGRV